jgi:acyl carrier protein
MKKKNFEDKLKKIFSKTLKINIKNIKDVDMYKIAQWDSLTHIKLTSEIQKKFKITIKDENSFKLTNYKKFLEFLIKESK